MAGSNVFLRYAVLFTATFALCTSTRAFAAPTKSECLDAYTSAQELRLNGTLLAARDKLLVCNQRGCPAPIVRDCIGWLGEVESALSAVVIAVTDEHGLEKVDARVSLGDRVLSDRTEGQPLVLDPGTYTFLVDAEGYAQTQQKLTLRASEKDRVVRVELHKLAPRLGVTAPSTPPEPAAPLLAATNEPATRETDEAGATHGGVPVVSYVLGGVALAGVGTFTYFGLRGLGEKHDADRCQSNCRKPIDDGRRDYLIADVGLGVAVAAASAAMIVILLQPKPSAATTSATAPELRLTF